MSRRKRPENGFEKWGGYMQAKKEKLQAQFSKNVFVENRLRSNSNEHGLFNGLSIFVNGYTVPSADELKRLMMVHGGTYLHYYNKQRCTHIIASNLPDSKVKELKGEKVVKPQWITDCIQAGNLISHEPYLLYSCVSSKQKTIPFVAVRSTDEQHVSDEINSACNNDSSKNNVCRQASTERGTKISKVSDDSREMSKGFPNSSEPLKSSNVIKSSINYDSNMVTMPNRKSTAVEKNFLSEFYSHSRLHHISTAGAEFKHYVSSLQLKGDESFPGLEKLKEMAATASVNVENTKNQLDEGSVIMHIDMDCFFVSVGLRNHPKLAGKPVAVAHSSGRTPINIEGSDFEYEQKMWSRKFRQKQCSANDDYFDDEDFETNSANVTAIPSMKKSESSSMSEIASCSYEARQAGVKNGMFLGPALKLCPDLVTIPYDFESYRRVSYALYDLIASYTHDIEAVSCDEMFVDCSNILSQISLTPLEFAEILRHEVKQKTGCNASAGLGHNILLARLATHTAKPNGSFHLKPSDVEDFMKNVPVADLPGVGRSIQARLGALNVTTCRELQKIPLKILTKELGLKTGENLFNFARGIDQRKIKVSHERKSVSTEVNYGIRFHEENEARNFIRQLSDEVANRLKNINAKGKNVSLKMKVRSKDAPVETAKFMGHGICDNMTRSVTLTTFSDDPTVISQRCWQLYRLMKIEAQELRGVGIHISKLKFSTFARGNQNSADSLTSFLKKMDQRQSSDSAMSEKYQTSSDLVFPCEVQSAESQKNNANRKSSEGHNQTNSESFTSHQMPSTSSSTHFAGDTEPSTSSCHHQVDQKMNTFDSDTKGLNGLSNVYPSHFSQVDQSVFQELPDEIREQVLSHFKTSPTETDGGEIAALPKINNIDRDVFAALPQDIQNELKLAYDRENKSIGSPTKASRLLKKPARRQSPDKSKRRNAKFSPRKCDLGIRKITDHLKISNARSESESVNNLMNYKISGPKSEHKLKSDHVTDIGVESNNEAKLCDATSIEDIKKLIQEWITTCEDPLNDDVTVFAEYLLDVVREENLEKLDLVIKFLHRLICKKQSKKWHEAYIQMISIMQEAVIKLYGLKLKVNF